ncbi:MAG: hypothetical protein UX72_C0004G0013 [Parcubacteria group bacterium GW2011_GWA2_47_10]|nr:MAG: hypothetical protein UX72_C0004G0013 [Parcubacteria group bacterium GW2011_GWA2_47_10]
MFRRFFDMTASLASTRHHPLPREVEQARQQVMQSIQSRLNSEKTLAERFADGLVRWFGSFSFGFLHVIVFAIWILINTEHFPNIPVFDPYPFNFLTMAVSLEAIFLSIFVLISQNRESQIADLRQEFDLQVNMIAESEITKVINLLAYLMDHLNVPYEQDPELQRMMRPLNVDEIRMELEGQLRLPKSKITPQGVALVPPSEIKES